MAMVALGYNADSLRQVLGTGPYAHAPPASSLPAAQPVDATAPADVQRRLHAEVNAELGANLAERVYNTFREEPESRWQAQRRHFAVMTANLQQQVRGTGAVERSCARS